jgi:hypothetical protein
MGACFFHAQKDLKEDGGGAMGKSGNQ